MINRKSIVFIIVFVVIFQITYAIPKTTISAMSSKNNNETNIIFQQNGIFNTIAQYGYISNPERYLYYFNNESCIGFLPKKTDSVLSPKNILKNEFICFFIDSTKGDIFEISESSGWDFHIIDQQENKKWIVISPKGKSRLLLINDTGEILNEIEFTTDFLGDYVTINWIDNSLYQLMISMLGRDAFYEIDLEKNESKFLYEEKGN